MPNMWSEVKMKEEAKQARLLAFFNRLTDNDKGLVLKVVEVIRKENQGISGDSFDDDLRNEVLNTDLLKCTRE
jgi:hypothetical protein